MRVLEYTDPAEIHDELWPPLREERSRLGFDVGGNCGQSLVDMVRRCETVVSYEPYSESYSHLQPKAVELCGMFLHTTIFTKQMAVSSQQGQIALLAKAKKLATGELVTVSWDEWGDTDRIVYVNATTLDAELELFGQPDLVKIDTEGHEEQILRGADQVLAGGTRWIIEIHSVTGGEAVKSILLEAGYLTKVVRHPLYARESIEYNRHYWLVGLPD